MAGLAEKSGAQVLAVNPKTGAPVLVVQNYGAGRSAAFTTGGSWHWQMALPKDDPLHERFWKQLVRWLAVGAKAKLTIELDKDIYAAREPVHVRATVLDRQLKPDNDAKVTAVIVDPFNNKQELPMRCILTGEGMYDTQFEPIDVGDYKIEVTAELADGAKVSATATFSVGETLNEFSDAAQDVALLKSIAAASGGRYVPIDRAGEIVQAVRRRVREMTVERTTYDQRDIWDTPLMFAVLALALSAEWFIRRRSGMM